MNDPGDRMIPANSRITDDQLKVLTDEIIPRREKELKKLRYGQVEMSLWLMGELERCRAIRDFNIELRTEHVVG